MIESFYNVGGALQQNTAYVDSWSLGAPSIAQVSCTFVIKTISWSLPDMSIRYNLLHISISYITCLKMNIWVQWNFVHSLHGSYLSFMASAVMSSFCVPFKLLSMLKEKEVL